MPTKPLSHAKRRGRPPKNARKQSDERYESEVRMTTPELKEAKRLRSSKGWQTIREIRLSRTPLCADPYGIHARDHHPTPAVEVDHILTYEKAPSRFLDIDNTQALCRSCHARKTGRERSERRQAEKTEATDPQQEETKTDGDVTDQEGKDGDILAD